MLISETRLTFKSYFSMNGYICYFTNHPSGKAHGGTGILVKNKIKQYALPKYENDFLQATTIAIIGHNGPLNISAIYCPPRHAITSDHFHDFFSTLGLKYIADGDWNAKHHYWDSRIISLRGRQLYKYIQLHNLECSSTGEPTHWPTDINKTPDLLDFYVHKGVNLNYLNVESVTDLSSDHTPTILTISTDIILKEETLRLINKHTDWERFKQNINETIVLDMPLKSAKQIKTAVEHLNNVIQSAAWKATPVIRKRIHQNNEYPLNIQNKIKEKRKLRSI